MTAEQYNAMTVEEKAAMFDEIQKHFIKQDGVPFDKSDMDAYNWLYWGYETLTSWDNPSSIISELVEHIQKMSFKDKGEAKGLLEISQAAALIELCKYFMEAEEYIKYRRNAQERA